MSTPYNKWTLKMHTSEIKKCSETRVILENSLRIIYFLHFIKCVSMRDTRFNLYVSMFE